MHKGYGVVPDPAALKVGQLNLPIPSPFQKIVQRFLGAVEFDTGHQVTAVHKSGRAEISSVGPVFVNGQIEPINDGCG